MIRFGNYRVASRFRATIKNLVREMSRYEFKSSFRGVLQIIVWRITDANYENYMDGIICLAFPRFTQQILIIKNLSYFYTLFPSTIYLTFAVGFI